MTDKKAEYAKCIGFWNEVFALEVPVFPKAAKTGIEEFDAGIAWLADGSESVVDFGCGNGTLLFICRNFGTKTHIGIDLSEQAIKSAVERSRAVQNENFSFINGGTEQLKRIADNSVDAAILSNILDNLYPDDAVSALDEIHRLLKSGGKLLVKLNPFLSEKQIKEWNIKTIEGNLLDDGLLLWNNTDAEWERLFKEKFSTVAKKEIYYKEAEQINRMYLLLKK